MVCAAPASSALPIEDAEETEYGALPMENAGTTSSIDPRQQKEVVAAVPAAAEATLNLDEEQDKPALDEQNAEGRGADLRKDENYQRPQRHELHAEEDDEVLQSEEDAEALADEGDGQPELRPEGVDDVLEE